MFLIVVISSVATDMRFVRISPSANYLNDKHFIRQLVLTNRNNYIYNLFQSSILFLAANYTHK